MGLYCKEDSRASHFHAMNRLLLFIAKYGLNSGLWAKTSLQEISICSAFYQRGWRAALQQQMLPSNWTVLETCHNSIYRAAPEGVEKGGVEGAR